MTDLCAEIRARLPSLAEDPRPDDPEERVLAPLRAHLADCLDCGEALAAYTRLLHLSDEAERSVPDALHDAVESQLMASESRFLDRLRVAGRGRGSSVAAPSSTHDTQHRLVFQLELPRRSLARASGDQPSPPTEPYLGQVTDPAGNWIVELLCAATNRRLFVTASPQELAGARVRVSLDNGLGQSEVHETILNAGKAEWPIPTHFDLAGMCGIVVELLEPGILRITDGDRRE